MSDGRAHIPGVRFPIQASLSFAVNVAALPDDRKPRVTIEAGWIPWTIAEIAYKVYCDAGHGSQTLERLAERGGFGWFELVALLRGSYDTASAAKAFDDAHDAAYRVFQRNLR